MTPPFTGLLPDPVRRAALKRKLPAVGSAPNPRNTIDRDQLIAIAQNPALNPLNYIPKRSQQQTNTCAANAGANARQRLDVAAHGHKATDPLSRMFLYLRARIRFAGNLYDEGTSIQSILDVLHDDGVPTEQMFPWGTWARNQAEIDRLCNAGIMADAATRKITTWTEATDDFDLAVSRILLGDPILWGTGWPFPNGQAGHATCPIWVQWNEDRRDFAILVLNSHDGNFVFPIGRNQYRTAINSSPFGAYHLKGSLNLRFDPATQDLL